MSNSCNGWKLARLLASLVAALPAAALAQSTGDAGHKAMAAQNAAVHEYEEGRYDDALEHFQDAYRLNAEPSLLLSIAKCRYRLRQYEAAKSCLFDFLRDDPKSVYGSEAFELLTRIEKEAAKSKEPKTVSCLSPPTAGGTGSVDSGLVAPPSQPGLTSPPASPAVATASPPAQPASAQTAVGAAQRGPAPPGATTTAMHRAEKSHTVVWIAAGASAAALATGAVFGAKTLSSRSSDDAQKANLLYAIGGGLAVVTGALLLLNF